jgi:hypothetical protein
MAEPPVETIGVRTTASSAAFVAAWAVLIGSVVWLGSSDGEPQRRAGAIAFAGAFLAVAVVAGIGLFRDRPWFLATSGVALMAMTVITFSPVAFPILLFPAAFIVARGLSDTRGWPRDGLVGAMVSAVALFLALASLIFHEDSAEWITADGIHHGSSNVITRTEVLISLSLSAGAVAVAWLSPGRHGLSAPAPD